MADDLSPEQIQTALARVLLERVRQENYPSSTQMDWLEQIIPPDLMREYVNVLLEKALSSRWPSVSIVRRLQRMMTRVQ